MLKLGQNQDLRCKLANPGSYGTSKERNRRPKIIVFKANRRRSIGLPQAKCLPRKSRYPAEYTLHYLHLQALMFFEQETKENPHALLHVHLSML
ncbi:hypothetical protein AVEN_108119-1 [Araneus ventricosus]|uniref:Uncharacterized protein n=1 Tax=Araneus ventricosus TaxID=182803 RepID=A0A4Y2H3W4_ARAVE|nr:hypothetical protein AVEN_108119-1 [Araneus ventricosus]